MIERHWKGVCKAEYALDYQNHLINQTFRNLNTIDGFVTSRILKRNLANGIEFLVITTWQSIDSIKAFAGDDVEKAVVPKLVQNYMVTYDAIAIHYETAWINT